MQKRTELLLDEPDSPIRAVKPLQPDWTPNQFIKFGPTDRTKDAAQLTIPFLDETFVEGNPSILSGAGKCCFCVKWQQLPLQHISVKYVEIQINRKM